MMWVFGPWNQAKRDPIDNAPVELVCQATSASPTYFPPVEFTLTDTKKEPHRGKTFRLIDGSLAINNPVYMVDLNLSLVFQSDKAAANYLRIQTDRLTGSFASIDTCGHEHLSQVTDLGKKLLDERVMQRDFKTGKLVPVADGITNRDALYR
ncbi:unnamed protein product [Sphagnum jensenii]|uniref:Patatin n=1 Tax=Sphagnum jensenii TaxID=128206 RepID=A0ABP0VWA1_9BRYO